MKKRLTLVTLTLCLLFMATIISYGEQKITIGYLPGYGTITNPDSQTGVGYGHEYFEEISKYTGWSYKYVPCQWSEGLRMLEDGTIDIFGPMQITEERKEKYDFPERDFGNEYGSMYVLGEKNIHYKDYPNFQNLRIGILDKSFYNPFIYELSDKYNLNFQYILSDGQDVSLDLKNGKYDAFVAGSLYDISDSKMVDKLSYYPFYYAVKKGNTELLEELNYGLSKIQSDSFTYNYELYNKYYGNKPISTPALSKEETALLNNKSSFIVNVEEYAQPVQYATSKGNPAGIALAVLDKIGENYGIEFQYYTTKQLSQQNLIPDLYITYNKSLHAKKSLYTDPFISLPMVLMSKKSTSIEDGTVAGIVTQSNIDMNLLKKYYSQYKFDFYPTVKELSDSFNQGDMDVAITSVYTADLLTKNQGKSNYITLNLDLSLPIDIGIAPHIPSQYVNIFNKAIKQVPTKELDSIVLSTMVMGSDNSFQKFVQENFTSILSFIIFVLTIIILLISAILIILRKNKQKLNNILSYDQITGLPSLFKFKEEASASLLKANSNEYMLLSLDVDKFSYINSIVGFQEGNTVLRIMADFFQKTCPPETFITRDFADLFYFFLKVSEPDSLLWDPNDLSKQLEETIGDMRNLSFSIGVYIVSDPKEDISTMIDKADTARRKGKNNFTTTLFYFNEAMEYEINKKREITLSMNQALENCEFVPYFQPHVELKTHEIVGAEILVRWFTSSGKMISPGEFISLFEENGFIKNLDMYMFERLCIWMKSHPETMNRFKGISVNISKATLLSQDFFSDLVSILEKYELSPNKIELELTESVFAKNFTDVIEQMAQLKNYGFLISIDDFGSGYSSFNLLKNLDIDLIKIDKEFFSEESLSHKTLEILKSIIIMGHSLGLGLIAEGVEKEEMIPVLTALKCDYVQGYYFYKPMSAEDFEKLI